MGGIYIRCGSFEGDDKCGSAIEGLLPELDVLVAPDLSDALTDIRRALNGEPDGDYGRIGLRHAINLIPILKQYVKEVQAAFGPIGSPFELINRDYAENPTLDYGVAKYGGSRGWRYYCAVNLLIACQTAEREQQDVILTWD